MTDQVPPPNGDDVPTHGTPGDSVAPTEPIPQADGQQPAAPAGTDWWPDATGSAADVPSAAATAPDVATPHKDRPWLVPAVAAGALAVGLVGGFASATVLHVGTGDAFRSSPVDRLIPGNGQQRLGGPDQDGDGFPPGFGVPGQGQPGDGTGQGQGQGSNGQGWSVQPPSSHTGTGASGATT